MSFIEFKNINLTFEGKPLFKDYTLTINKHDKLQIMGKSGNGKSTLLKILLGFTTIDSGQIIINGKEIKGKDFKEARKLFAYVNQDVTIRQGNIKEILKEISKFSGNNFDGVLDKELMNLLEFDSSLLNKSTDDLSGGERQRLGILIGIALNREVFLLDEVTSALDLELKEKVVRYFSNCDKTIITISHDPEWQEKGNFKGVVI